MDSEDAAIVEQLKCKEEEGLRRLLTRHGGAICRLLRRRFLLAEDHELEEAMNRAAYRFWMNADRFDPAKGSLRAYFFQVVRWEMLDLMRNEARQINGHLPPDFDVEDSRSPAPEADEPEWFQALYEVIEGLTPQQQAVIRADLKAGGRADVDDLARKLNTNTTTIYAARHNARKAIRDRLHQRGYRFDEAAGFLIHEPDPKGKV